MSDATASYHYLYDANGNVGQLINAADGSIAAHYEYDPFGNLTAKSGPYADANPFRFSTKHFDADTGLYDFGLRDYSPVLGRWTGRDPIAELGNALLRDKQYHIEIKKHLYVFVMNNPIFLNDPFGLSESWLLYDENGQVIGEIGIETPFIDAVDVAEIIVGFGAVKTTLHQI